MSVAEPLRAAVVGVGHLGRHHARIYGELAETDLVGVHDHDEARGREIAEANGTRFEPELSRLLGAVDLVSVAVPTEAHCEVAVAALEAGAHVLVEKPIARSLVEADRMIDAAKAAGRHLLVGHSGRFNPAVVALAGAVDRPRFFEVHRLAAFSMRSTDVDVVLDLMIHDLDLLLYLDGTEPVGVDAVGVAALTDKVDIANVRLRFDSGCVANLTASRISAEPMRRIRCFQSRTYLSCDSGQGKVERYRLRPAPGERRKIEHDLLPVAESEPLVGELAAFAALVRGEPVTVVDAQQGRRALALAMQIHDAIADAAS